MQAESFSDQMVFSRQSFPAPGSKKVLSYYSYRTRFIKYELFCFYPECRQENNYDYGEKNWKGGYKPREDQHKSLKIKAKFFMVGWEKDTVQKTN